jgi:TonB family protein
MTILILLAVLSVTPKAPAVPAPVAPSASDVQASTEIGLYSVKAGQITAEALKATFKKHLKLKNAEYQKTGGSLSEPWKDFGELKDRITWQTLTRYQPEWRYTDSERTTWVYQAPDFGNDWPTKALQIADKSDSSGYKLDVTVYCTGNETECEPYIAAKKSMLAPHPGGMQSDTAYQQWHNRVKLESCDVRPKSMSQPRYPSQALRDGIGGTVRIGFLYNRCGNVRDAWIATSSRNRDLDRAALNEVLKWQIDTTTLPEGKNTGMAIAPITFMPE